MWEPDAGEGEASVAFYFGDGYLFDLSEIDFEGEIPLTQAASVSVVVCLTAAGLPSLTHQFRGHNTYPL